MQKASVDDLMRSPVTTFSPDDPLKRVKEVMVEHGFSCAPITGEDDTLLGIVTATDLLAEFDPAAPASSLMHTKVYTVPRYAATNLPARMMRNHGIHHLVVVHEQKVVGVLSSFDLLKLVEEHAYVAKNPSSENKRKRGKRGREEQEAAEQRGE